MIVSAVALGLFILVTFIAVWYLVYDEVAQRTGMKTPRFGAEARRSRRLFWLVTALSVVSLVVAWALVR
ncbi:MAG: hypothetical protein V3V91_02885 [Thermoplasmata archaeon]